MCGGCFSLCFALWYKLTYSGLTVLLTGSDTVHLIIHYDMKVGGLRT